MAMHNLRTFAAIVGVLSMAAGCSIGAGVAASTAEVDATRCRARRA